MELKKAFCSKKFLLGICLLLLFAVLSAVYMIEGRAGYNPDSILASMEGGQFTHNPDLGGLTTWNARLAI